jgi:hypothetical protein
MLKNIIEINIQTPEENFLIQLPLTGHEYTDQLVLDSAFDEAHEILKMYYENKEEALGKSNAGGN